MAMSSRTCSRFRSLALLAFLLFVVRPGNSQLITSIQSLQRGCLQSLQFLGVGNFGFSSSDCSVGSVSVSSNSDEPAFASSVSVASPEVDPFVFEDDYTFDPFIFEDDEFEDPFSVVGGDDEVVDADFVARNTLRRNKDRPSGPWEFAVEARVTKTPGVVWEALQSYGNFLAYSLKDLAVNFAAQDNELKEWLVDLNNGGQVTFKVIESNEDKRYHIAAIEKHTPAVFPSVNVEGSVMYVQAVAGDLPSTTIIELGWGGTVRGPRDVAITQIESLFQEMVDNLKKKFGETCEQSKKFRSIEGDCNNLGLPAMGAAGHALKRLEKHDPAFPDGTGDIPSGAREISPRDVSNLVHQQSPGMEILRPQLEEIKDECAESGIGLGRWKVCPFDKAESFRGRTKILDLKWDGVDSAEDGSLVMKFSSKDCEIGLMFTCAGTIELDMQPDPCGLSNHRFFHPKACVIKPGKDNVMVNSAGLTDMFWSWGQFVDHDLGLTPTAQIADSDQPGFSLNARTAVNKVQLPISVPEDDPFFKTEEMEFERSIASQRQGPPSHVNQLSAFLDLGQVYGSDFLRANALRSFTDGKLKIQPDGMPPFNKIDGPGALRAKLDNAPDATDRFYAVGDIRGNEQATLLSLHTLWLREHNRVCDELKEAFPAWDDERLYQTGRAIVISEYQSIQYTEWLPLLLGPGHITASGYSYDASIDPTITAVFSTVAFRFGHSMVGSYLWKIGSGPRDSANLDLVPVRDVFFNPEIVARDGIAAFLRGAAWHPAKEVDSKVVDELRNFLFTNETDTPHMDLVSLNIQRGRDMGMPSFNDLRDAMGLPAYKSIGEITKDEAVATMLAKVYKNRLDKVDPFTGGLSEDHVVGSTLGPLFHAIIKDQFLRIRDGDRFFYKGIDWAQNVLDNYPRLQTIIDDGVKLGDIIVRNTGVTKEELGDRRSVFKL